MKSDPFWSLHLSNKVWKLKNASDDSEVQILIVMDIWYNSILMNMTEGLVYFDGYQI